MEHYTPSGGEARYSNLCGMSCVQLCCVCETVIALITVEYYAAMFLKCTEAGSGNFRAFAVFARIES